MQVENHYILSTTQSVNVKLEDAEAKLWLSQPAGAEEGNIRTDI